MPLTQHTIQIDFEQAGRTVTVLRNSHNDLTTELAALVHVVDALLPTWDGNSKQAFVPTWEEWIRSMREVLAAVTPLADGIQRETDAIRATDTTSSYRA